MLSCILLLLFYVHYPKKIIKDSRLFAGWESKYNKSKNSETEKYHKDKKLWERGCIMPPSATNKTPALWAESRVVLVVHL